MTTSLQERRAAVRRSAEDRGIVKRRKTIPVDLGGCLVCGHLVYDLGGTLYCPCEDDHGDKLGGLVQVQEERPLTAGTTRR